MPSATDRPRGILTPADRALLLGFKEYNHKQQYSNRRKDIRKRTANALLDFSLLRHSLQSKDRKRIFQNPADEAGIDEAQLQESIQSMLYWTYLGLKEQQYDFEGLLTQAIEEAEEDYAQKYLGRAVEIVVNFNVEVTRSHDVEVLISQIESGGPVPATRLYDLLQIPGGVPIDVEDLDTLRVWFKSAYPKGERAVLETLFSEYLGADVEIVDAEARVDLDELGIEKRDAVIDSTGSVSDPSEIKYNSSPIHSPSEETVEELQNEARRRRSREEGKNKSESSSSVLSDVIDSQVEESDDVSPSIYTVIENKSREGQEVTPENVTELLEYVREQIVSTEDVAAAFGCTPDIARRALSKISKLNERSVLDTQQNRMEIWVRS